jgi:3-oxoacyl-[acyl-carrier-protein] synthase II
MNARRVVITGVGAVSAAGIGAQPLLELVLAGLSAVHPVASLDGLPAGAVPELPPDRRTRRLDRAARLFVAAGEEAWRDAGLAAQPGDGHRFALIEGSSLGSLADLLDQHRAYVERHDHRPAGPGALIRYMAGAGGALLAQAHQIHGPVFHLSAGSVSAMVAIGEAYQKVASGAADVALAGGGDCPLQREVAAAFAASGILAHEAAASAPCRPFDRRRTGTVLGEAAGAVVLESEAHALARGARIRAVASGYGLSCEAGSMTAPDPDGSGVAAAALQALGEAGRPPIGWVKTHGTGTVLNDRAECRGLARVFGAALTASPLTSLKAAIGHSCGASGGVETALAVLAMERSIVPPSVGTEQVDPDLPPCRIALGAEPSGGRAALLLAESFGGRCAALVLQAA